MTINAKTKKHLKTTFFCFLVLFVSSCHPPAQEGTKKRGKSETPKNQRRQAAATRAKPGKAQAINEMSSDKLRAYLEQKAKEYKPPEAALKVLPFNPSEWTTNGDYENIGDPKARKGGQITWVWPSFPPNLRTDGPNSNLIQTSTIHGLIYEFLLNLHPTTLKFIPCLATHWKISSDKRTFWFHINPKARFSDGSEVTSDDVYWSFWHMIQKDRKDPYNVLLFSSSFEIPEIIDKYTIKVHTKHLNWRLFLYFGASLKIFPAEYIHITGEEYLNGYQWHFIPGSGPYILRRGDLNKPSSLTLSRRTDWWAKHERWATGQYNFDKIIFYVISGEELEFQKFKHRELDYYRIRKAQRWVEECNFDAIKKGWVKKRRIKTEAPQGFNGFCFNMRKPPFNDRRVRMAWAYLFNREKLMKELFFNQYDYIDSLYPGRIWANPGNPKIRFNPLKASILLKEAGYIKRDGQGVLIGPNGKSFKITLEITSESMKRIFTTVIKDYWKAGIDITLKLIDPRTLYKKISDRQFTVTYQWWGAIIFPNPESSWMSKLADAKSNNNLPGYRSFRVDNLCEEYNVCFDQEKRVEIIRKIDKIICEDFPYALGWYTNRERILYWDKFGHPSRYFSRSGDYRDILSLWWIDKEKSKKLEQAIKNNNPLGQGQVEVAPWDDLGKQGLPEDEK